MHNSIQCKDNNQNMYEPTGGLYVIYYILSGVSHIKI